jgi:predicted dehydrogenase
MNPKALALMEAREKPRSSAQVGIAVVGCGYWGGNYVRLFSELPDARVVAVCDQRPDRLREVGRRFPGVHLTTQVDDAATHHGVDAVVVCTEASTHYDVVSRALLARKHVLVEKPITTVSSDAERLIDLAESCSSTLMVGHTFLFNAGVRKVKEYVQSGNGRVYYLYARRTNLGPIRRDVNALWDLAPHDIAIFNYLLDRTPQWVSAVGGKVLGNRLHDVGFISLGYPENVIANIHVSWADPDKAREVVVVKNDKRIVFNDLNLVEPVRVFEKGVTPVEQEAMSYDDFLFEIRDGDITSPRIEMVEPLKSQCRHFLECIVNWKRPISGGVEGLDVVRVLEAVSRSIESRGLQVEVENKGEYGLRNINALESAAGVVR